MDLPKIRNLSHPSNDFFMFYFECFFFYLKFFFKHSFFHSPFAAHVILIFSCILFFFMYLSGNCLSWYDCHTCRLLQQLLQVLLVKHTSEHREMISSQAPYPAPGKNISYQTSCHTKFLHATQFYLVPMSCIAEHLFIMASIFFPYLILACLMVFFPSFIWSQNLFGHHLASIFLTCP